MLAIWAHKAVSAQADLFYLLLLGMSQALDHAPARLHARPGPGSAVEQHAWLSLVDDPSQ